jgi:hypothetical protein
MTDDAKTGNKRRNRGAEARSRQEANRAAARQQLGVTRPRTAHWAEKAACATRDPELFFTDVDSAKAKEVCRDCPVISECLRAHLFEQYGVFGGMTPEDRDRYRRNIRRSAR